MQAAPVFRDSSPARLRTAGQHVWRCPARLRGCRLACLMLLFLRARAGLAAAGAQQGASSALAAGQPAAWNLTAPGPVSVLATTLPAAAAPVRVCCGCSSASHVMVRPC